MLTVQHQYPKPRLEIISILHEYFVHDISAERQEHVHDFLYTCEGCGHNGVIVASITGCSSNARCISDVYYRWAGFAVTIRNHLHITWLRFLYLDLHPAATRELPADEDTDRSANKAIADSRLRPRCTTHDEHLLQSLPLSKIWLDLSAVMPRNIGYMMRRACRLHSWASVQPTVLITQTTRPNFIFSARCPYIFSLLKSHNKRTWQKKWKTNRRLTE